MELTKIPGIGEKSEKALNEKGIFSYEDLAQIRPIKYYEINDASEFNPNAEKISLEIKLISKPQILRIKKLLITKAKAEDIKSKTELELVWYNQKYVGQVYEVGKAYFVFGNIKQKHLQVLLMVDLENKKDIIGLFPIYKRYGIPRKTLINAIKYSQSNIKLTSKISKQEEEKYNLMGLLESYKILNNPISTKELELANFRIDVEKAIDFITSEGSFVRQNRINRKPLDCSKCNILIKKLPFMLTKSQHLALKNVIDDFLGEKSCNRLIQGEVGSGKTILAFLSALIFVQNSYQVAIMAPTEILARQHYENFNNIFGINYDSVLLTSSQKNKNEIYNLIKHKSPLIIFGTHVLANSVEFNNLGLVIIDEQHRFGVETRAKLIEKSKTRDTISLSATPIPRSLMLSLMNILSISQLNERPSSYNISTHIVNEKYYERLWNYINHQDKCFVVCPRIYDIDDPFSEQKSNVEIFQKKLESKFGKSQVLRLDGDMKQLEQENIIKQFKLGNEKILLSTTIIEVGVDLKNVNNMVILGAENFGLATLHQLRGRIGRDGKEAHCFLLFDKKKISKKSYERIKFFKEHDNGLEIAEFDFNTRGTGDIFGLRQSGDCNWPFTMQALKVADKLIGNREKKIYISNN